MDRIREMETWKDARINEAKKVLAYEVTAIVHGREEADKVHRAAEAIFSKGEDSANMPSATIGRSELKEGINILDLLVRTGFIPSKGEGRRLIQQGGLYLNNARVETIDRIVDESDLKDSRMIVRKGKKSYYRIVAE
jgi:tyrosyl-tRNA synthetase